VLVQQQNSPAPDDAGSHVKEAERGIAVFKFNKAAFFPCSPSTGCYQLDEDCALKIQVRELAYN